MWAQPAKDVIRYAIRFPDPRRHDQTGRAQTHALHADREGERLVAYNPPAVDESLYTPTPITPVPAEAMEVTFTVEPRADEEVWPIIRALRANLLVQSDWTQLPDVPLATKTAWADYRQALRDVTLQPDPRNIIWPTPPQ